MSILIKSLFLLNILFSPSFAGIFDFKSNDEKLYDILVDLNQDTKQYKNQLDISKNAERLFKIFKEKYKNVDNKLLNSITRFYNYRLDYGWDYSAQVKLKLLENFANKKIDLRILLDLMESFNDVRELTPFLSLFEKYASREKPIDEALELQKVFNTFSECAFPKSDPRKTVFKPVVEAFQQQKLCLNEFKKFYPLMCPNDVSFLIVDSQDKCKNINEKYKSLYEFVSKLNKIDDDQWANCHTIIEYFNDKFDFDHKNNIDNLNQYALELESEGLLEDFYKAFEKHQSIYEWSRLVTICINNLDYYKNIAIQSHAIRTPDSSRNMNKKTPIEKTDTQESGTRRK